MQFEHLNKNHNKQAFDCGNDDINHYLKTMANQHAKNSIAKTHVLTENQRDILGFYTLVNITLDNSDLAIKGYPRQIGAILISRIGVAMAHQGKGISKLLLSHALKKIKHISLYRHRFCGDRCQKSNLG